MNEIFLQPGEYYVGDATHRVRTILGSCVSITLWHRKKQFGAMSHFVLATRITPRGEAELDARYGNEALELMLRELAIEGVAGEDCEAKLFGGGNMFPDQPRATDRNVGWMNGEAARELMRAQGIRVVSESLYGNGHRQVIFDIRTGHVWSRQVEPKSDPQTRKP